MARSCWKVPFIDLSFFTKKFNSSKNFNTYKRNSLIGVNFLDKRLRVYNGLRFISFIVRKNMIGKRLGEFSFTKITGRDIAESMQRKKKAKMKQKRRKK